jgi:hypothetical protein
VIVESYEVLLTLEHGSATAIGVDVEDDVAVGVGDGVGVFL